MNASEEFWDAIIDSGSPVIDCGFCHRTHFDRSGEFMDSGELDQILVKARLLPDKYVAVDGQPRWGRINGRQAVYDCPCGKVREIESLIWSSRRAISRYLKTRAINQLKAAQEEFNEIKTIP